jgi:hypothetical protein
MPNGSSQMGHFIVGRPKMANKFSLMIHNSEIPASVVFSIFSCCIKSGDHPQGDLVRSAYKTNKEVEILRSLLCIGKPLEHIN